MSESRNLFLSHGYYVLEFNYFEEKQFSFFQWLFTAISSYVIIKNYFLTFHCLNNLLLANR